MSNLLVNWWRSHKFNEAVKSQNNRLAKQLLKQIENSGAKLSWQQKLFKERLQLEKLLQKKNDRIKEGDRHLAELEIQLSFGQLDDSLARMDESTLFPDTKLIEYISKAFKLIECDASMIQCTGIDEKVFNKFEQHLAGFIKNEINKLTREKTNIDYLLKQAVDDIQKLKEGQDPQYSFELSPHIYLMRYFLDNVYCAYLAWFLVYKAGLLPTKLNILDIAAGPGTVAYGLGLLLQSSSDFFSMPPMHISYYSLEQQKAFQYRGLQFWRQYMEPQAMNAYFRFDTSSIFDGENQSKRLPKKFFDFIVISHCFFNDEERREKSLQIYKDIFTSTLNDSGCVLLIIQEKKLLIPYNVSRVDDCQQELSVVQQFVDELGLNLVWYKYLSSTGIRTSHPNYAKFARKNLPVKEFISPLFRQHFKLHYDSNYALDDYVILAKK
ncbi:photosystem II assembly protein [Tychonema sp. LEGE 07199]|uniref:photosystem II assembly protein n=1 Tax=unclassified Tychonema TaxID=2642144 RepID=UPI001881B0E7|nr:MULTISPECIES: photosystem II assembly protein [unclassified Tychonema]MBE9123495.1 photosystem II assembly protein [Tychonema sp. LEGE 07199]MBE9131171.1 photosystem II assembly protein [Tychonema sp. LEGE 07196]